MTLGFGAKNLHRWSKACVCFITEGGFVCFLLCNNCVNCPLVLIGGCFPFQVRLEPVAVVTGSVMMVPVFSAHGDVMEQVTAWMDLMRWTAVYTLLCVGMDVKLLCMFDNVVILSLCNPPPMLREI